MAPDNGGRSAPRDRRRAVATTGPRPRWPVGLVVVACAALATVSTGCTQRGPAADPVALLATTQDGDQPWTDRLLPPQTPTIVPPGPQGSDLSVEATPVVTGDRGGLYGGSPDRPLCDSARLVDDLERDPAKLTAWAKVQGVSDVRGFVNTLTPVLLRADTRVTNFGYDGGRAVPRESVLESGTIVLIDEHGVPKVRCAHGAPLDTPTATVAPDPRAVPWPGFDAGRILTIRPALDAMGVVSVVDLATGSLTAVPVGSGAVASAPPPTKTAAPTPAPVVSAPAVSTPVDQAPRRALAEAPEPAAPAPEPPPPPPAPEPAPAAPAPAPAPVVVPQPQPVAPPPEIRLEVPGLPPLVIPIPR